MDEKSGSLWERRSLFSVLGVDEDDGAYVVVAGIILICLTICSCCYCKVYDPIKRYIIKRYQACQKKKRSPVEKSKERKIPEDRQHWYLNKTLEIDNQDRKEMGPEKMWKNDDGGAVLKGGWYGARNGGFDV